MSLIDILGTCTLAGMALVVCAAACVRRGQGHLKEFRYALPDLEERGDLPQAMVFAGRIDFWTRAAYACLIGGGALALLSGTALVIVSRIS